MPLPKKPRESAILLRALATQTAPVKPSGWISQHYLKQMAIYQEFMQEKERLIAMISSGQPEGFIKEAFKSACQERAIENTDSDLSFCVAPTNPVNRMYWTIATLLFKPKTMHDMLAILHPEVTEYITPSAIICRASSSQFNLITDLKMTIENKDMGELRDKPKLKRLQRLVIAGHRLINVEDISLFNFELHQAFYEQLKIAYPALAIRLYQHNTALRTLADQIDMVTGGTPYKVLSSLIQRLKLGGESNTGNIFASFSTETAVIKFMLYLEALPAPIKLKLLALKGTEKTVADIQKHLNKGDCVEQAAHYLQSVIANPLNQDFLKHPPGMPDDYLHLIKQTYCQTKKRRYVLPITAEGGMIKLPEARLYAILSTITIRMASDCIGILTSFPTEHYEAILLNANMKFDITFATSLAAHMQNNFLDERQKLALCEALVAARLRFDPYIILNFYLTLGNIEQTSALIHALSDEQKEKITQCDHGRILMDKAARSPALVDIILNLYPVSKRFDAIRISNLRDRINTPLMLQTVLSQCSPDKHQDLLMIQTKASKPLLHQITQDPKFIRVVLSCCGEGVHAMLIDNQWGAQVLHQLVDDAPSLQNVFKLYSMTKRLVMLNKKGPTIPGASPPSLWEKLIEHPSSLCLILPLCPTLSTLPSAIHALFIDALGGQSNRPGIQKILTLMTTLHEKSLAMPLVCLQHLAKKELPHSPVAFFFGNKKRDMPIQQLCKLMAKDDFAQRTSWEDITTLLLPLLPKSRRIDYAKTSLLMEHEESHPRQLGKL